MNNSTALARLEPEAGVIPADALPTLSQWRLMMRRFRRHRLAVLGGIVVATFYLAAIFAEFLGTADPALSDAQRVTVPPQAIHWLQNGGFSPHTHRLSRTRDPATLQLVYRPTSETIPVQILGHGHAYKLFGLIPADRHLFANASSERRPDLFLLGTDTLGRDVWSRLLLGLRTSLFVGLAAVTVSLLIGTVMGIVSGYYGGVIDTVIQRLIEVLRAIPTIPLWMGLAAAIPSDWGVTTVYLAITLIIALIGWTELARELRGRIISLRHEDFVLAARLSGATSGRIMRVHLLPSVFSHIIAATTLAIPGMIASETALGFLGLGLRPPAISLGVMLKDAQDMQNLALNPWLLVPAIPTALIILAFNFFGDGLRDAADPYG